MRDTRMAVRFESRWALPDIITAIRHFILSLRYFIVISAEFCLDEFYSPVRDRHDVGNSYSRFQCLVLRRRRYD